jgi:hypothetical protein
MKMAASFQHFSEWRRVRQRSLAFRFHRDIADAEGSLRGKVDCFISLNEG